MLHYFHNFFVNHRFNNTGTYMSMNHNMFVFGRSKFTGLVLNNLVNGNLTDIVQQTTPSQIL